jgi:hypothetical protein
MELKEGQRKNVVMENERIIGMTEQWGVPSCALRVL